MKRTNGKEIVKMIREAYERLSMDVTQFDIEDVITTSGVTPGGGDSHNLNPGDYEGIFIPVGG